MSNSSGTDVGTEAARSTDPAGGFARAFTAAAGKLLAADVQIFFPALTREPAEQFFQSCQGACYALHAGQSAEADAWCDIEPPLALAIACRLLGCEKTASIDQRPLTEVERRLGARAAEAAAQAADDTRQWRASPTTTPGGATDPLTVLRLGVSLGRSSGVLRLAMRNALPADAHAPTAAAPAGPIELRVTTEDFNVSDETLASLSVGDVLATDLATDAEVIIRVAGVPKFAGRLGQFKGRRAVVITRKLF